MAVSEPSSLTAESPRYPNKPENQDTDIKSLVRMLVAEHMEKYLEETHEKIDQKFEALTRKT